MMSVPFRVFLVLFTMMAAAGLPSRPALAQSPSLQVYPFPAGAPQSSLFTVTIQPQGGPEQNAGVYETQNPLLVQPPFEKTTAWTSFGSDTPVTVQVVNKTPFASARILPTSAGIAPTLSGQNGSTYTTLSFPLGGNGAQQVSVEFCYSPAALTCTEATQMLTDIANPLLVFVNPLSTNVAPPVPAPQVLMATPYAPVMPLFGPRTMIYFPPGVYDLGTTPYLLTNGNQAFLEGGAYVRGMFAISDGSKIQGPGVLSGDVCTRSKDNPWCYMMIAASAPAGTQPKPTSGITLSGITLVNAPYYNILLGGSGNTVSNIKVMSWLANTDGISAGSGSLSNSFFKVGDDAIKLYASNFTVSGCTMWHLGNAAPFELGVNLSEPTLTNITVQNCDVIRTEWTYPNRSNAVFSAAFGGNTNSSGYLFQDIRIENTNTPWFQDNKVGSVFQLFKLAVIPNPYTQSGNNQLGSISGVKFSNIQVTDSVTLPNLFQSFDWRHKVSGIVFDNVTVNGQTQSSPTTPIYNANRNLSLSGTVFSNILWQGASDPTSWLLDVFTGPAGSKPSSQTPLSGPATTIPGFENPWAIGDVDGQGQASVLFLDTRTAGVVIYGLWHQPMSPSPGAFEIFRYDLNSSPTGIGDFNGDGRSDFVLWNATTQIGTIVLMAGAQHDGVYFTPPPPVQGKWSVAGVGDIDQNGYSDLILRDQDGNIGVWSFAGGPTPTWQYLPVNDFTYDGGVFDASWSVAAVGDARGNGYASIVWFNSTLCKVAITGFAFAAPPKATQGTILNPATPNCAPVRATGDYNGDGTMDLLLVDSSGNQTIWYLQYNSGALYLPGPTLLPQSGYTLVP